MPPIAIHVHPLIYTPNSGLQAHAAGLAQSRAQVFFCVEMECDGWGNAISARRKDPSQCRFRSLKLSPFASITSSQLCVASSFAFLNPVKYIQDEIAQIKTAPTCRHSFIHPAHCLEMRKRHGRQRQARFIPRAARRREFGPFPREIGPKTRREMPHPQTGAPYGKSGGGRKKGLSGLQRVSSSKRRERKVGILE